MPGCRAGLLAPLLAPPPLRRPPAACAGHSLPALSRCPCCNAQGPLKPCTHKPQGQQTQAG